MKPSRLYSRNYLVLDRDEQLEKQRYVAATKAIDVLHIPTRDTLSRAVRHSLSLFPNNYLELRDLHAETDLKALNQKFYSLIHREGALERDALNFINQTPAYHIICSVLKDRFHFGHHDCYVFKEFWLGDDYRTDYLIIGNGSGGHEFVLIELEKPDGRITLKDGHWGEAFRKGDYQIQDWESWMDAHFSRFADDLALVKGEQPLPEELMEYDRTRFHFMVIAGLREDFNDKTYKSRRRELQTTGVHFLHHDNLYDESVKLESAQSF